MKKFIICIKEEFVYDVQVMENEYIEALQEAEINDRYDKDIEPSDYGKRDFFGPVIIGYENATNEYHALRAASKKYNIHFDMIVGIEVVK